MKEEGIGAVSWRPLLDERGVRVSLPPAFCLGVRSKRANCRHRSSYWYLSTLLILIQRERYNISSNKLKYHFGRILNIRRAESQFDAYEFQCWIFVYCMLMQWSIRAVVDAVIDRDTCCNCSDTNSIPPLGIRGDGRQNAFSAMDRKIWSDRYSYDTRYIDLVVS